MPEIEDEPDVEAGNGDLLGNQCPDTDYCCSCELPDNVSIYKVICKLKHTSDTTFYLVSWNETNSISQICDKDFFRADHPLPDNSCIDATCLEECVVWDIINSSTNVDDATENLLDKIILEKGSLEKVIIKFSNPDDPTKNLLANIKLNHCQSRVTSKPIDELTFQKINKCNIKLDEVLDCTDLETKTIQELWEQSGEEIEKFLLLCKEEVLDNNILNSFNDTSKLNCLPSNNKRNISSPIRKSLSLSPRKKKSKHYQQSTVLNAPRVCCCTMFYNFLIVLNTKILYAG